MRFIIDESKDSEAPMKIRLELDFATGAVNVIAGNDSCILEIFPNGMFRRSACVNSGLGFPVDNCGRLIEKDSYIIDDKDQR